MNNLPLNVALSRAGLCSRRTAEQHIRNGRVTVNGTLITLPHYRLSKNDLVAFEGRSLQLTLPIFYYITLNKPAGYITTTSDPHQRKTVLDLIKINARLFPIGRLDRETTGLLLLTNDGALSQQLMHPRFEIQKTYRVVLDRAISESDLVRLRAGIQLSDGLAKPDNCWKLRKAPSTLIIQLHSGKNRIIRRMISALDYEARELERIAYAGLTLKNLARGHWRHLTQAELVLLRKSPAT